MKEVGLEEMKTYISRTQDRVSQYIAAQPIMDLYLEVDWSLGLKVTKMW